MIRLVVDVNLSPLWVDLVLPDRIGPMVVSVIRTYESQLEEGAIVTVDESRGKVRILPIGSKKS